MQFLPIKTRPLLPPKDNLLAVIDKSIPKLQEGDILFVTSKVISIHQGRCVPTKGTDKKKLIEKEADSWLITDVVPGRHIYITIKNNILIPSAGIDESNANGHYILRPNSLNEFCKKLHSKLCKKFGLKKLGIVVTDSTTRPLKRGVVGTGIYAYGFYPLINKIGHKDIFGRKLEFTQINIVDALSGMATYFMGEGDECQPLLIGRDIPGIKYTNKDIYNKTLEISPEKDIYNALLAPLLKPLKK